ncbi:MAG: glycosyltransferase family 1 protein [Sphingobacteriales bacterium]|nr:MAG: glycosyltransferase family 1 protein [Sphingobacteriales bacterium]TAF83882.1 MAG: glycosyltransferase family 1 protein [Sphingobacteriales bacterium]
MKIGYEAKRVFKNFTGLGNYSRWLIYSVATTYPRYSLFLYSPQNSINPRVIFLQNFKNIIICTPASRFIKFLWRSWGVVNDAKKNGIEIFHGLSNEIPLGLKSKNIKAVVTIHDLIFIRYPQYFNYIDRLIYKFKFNYACKKADTIIAISQQTKQDIVHYLGINAYKIDVVYQGCDASFYEKPLPNTLLSVKKTYQLPDVFLLCVGTIETRKNQLLIIKALTLLPNNTTLVLIGKSTTYKNVLETYIAQNHLQTRVLFLHNVAFNHLPSIYRLAKIFIYPSVFEGFGIPILEALNCDVPVIAAKGSCLEEAGGSHSIYINPYNETELANKITLILNDDALRQNMIMAGKKYALNFREDIIAQQLVAIYQKTLLKC